MKMNELGSRPRKTAFKRVVEPSRAPCIRTGCAKLVIMAAHPSGILIVTSLDKISLLIRHDILIIEADLCKDASAPPRAPSLSKPSDPVTAHRISDRSFYLRLQHRLKFLQRNSFVSETQP